MGLYERFSGGETLHVRTPEGKRFYARPEYASVYGLPFLAGYTLLNEKMKRIPGKYRKQMELQDLQEWLTCLIEIKGHKKNESV